MRHGGAGGSRTKFVEGIIGWFEHMLGAHDVVAKLPLAEVWHCDGDMASQLEPAFNPMPLQSIRDSLRAITSAAKRTDVGDSSMRGWETAIAFETLRELAERKVGVADWFDLFKAHNVSKRTRLKEENLLASFVVGLNNLQLLGFATLSKRSRGTLDKMVFG